MWLRPHKGERLPSRDGGAWEGAPPPKGGRGVLVFRIIRIVGVCSSPTTGAGVGINRRFTTAARARVGSRAATLLAARLLSIVPRLLSTTLLSVVC